MNKTVIEIIKARYIYLFLLLPFSLVAVFIFYPFARGLQLSLFDSNGAQIYDFIGFDNYKELLLEDPLFIRSLKNVLILSMVYLAQSLIISFFLAWLIHHLRSVRGKYVFRIFVILPSLIPAIVGWLLWKKFYESEGLVNRLLDLVGLVEWQQAWLGDVSIVLFAIAFAGFPWINGANTLILLAGFLQIPKDMYEAAKIDGASNWSILKRIEIPMLLGQIRILLVLSLIFVLQNYDNVFILTQGGPMDSSVVPGIMLYKNAFLFGRYGYASAIGVFMFAFIIILSLISMRFSNNSKETHR